MGTRKNFINKMYEIISDPATDGFIRWADDGTSFMITDESELTRILPMHFKHSNLSSLVRQLHQYGFSKSSGDDGEMIFSNSLFRRGHEEVLESIHRKGQNTVSSLKAENEEMSRRLEKLESEKAILMKENRSLLCENDLLKSRMGTDSLFGMPSTSSGGDWNMPPMSSKMEMDEVDSMSSATPNEMFMEGFSLPPVEFFSGSKRMDIADSSSLDPIDELMMSNPPASSSALSVVKSEEGFLPELTLTRANSNLGEWNEMGNPFESSWTRRDTDDMWFY
jgi:regulator of replication initiation timing